MTNQNQDGRHANTRTITANHRELAPPDLVLRLRAPDISNSDVNNAGITWDSSVIDNEHLDKKSSKKCCIFHKKRRFDESDTESEGEDSDSEDEFRKLHPNAL